MDSIPPPSSGLTEAHDESDSLDREAALNGWSEAEARVALEKYDALIRSEARRLRSLAQRSNTLDSEDLCAEGRIAALEALRRFQGWGVNEVTWVRMRVRQRMLDAIRRTSLWSRMDTRLFAKERRGEALTDRERERAIDASQRKHVSFDIDVGQQTPLADILPDPLESGTDEMVDEKRQATRLREAIATLPERTRKVVEAVLLEGRAARDVAADMGVSESRVSQILHGAVPELRSRMALEHRGINEERPKRMRKAARV